MIRLLPIAFLVALVSVGAGCDGSSSGDNRLFGSAASTFDLDFDQVNVKKQYMGGNWIAIVVEYVKKVKNSSNTYLPCKVVINAPVSEGKVINLVTNKANVYRVMNQGGAFPEIEKGTIEFDELGAEGGSVSGVFYTTFKDNKSTTLNGEFSSTLEKVGS